MWFSVVCWLAHIVLCNALRPYPQQPLRGMHKLRLEGQSLWAKPISRSVIDSPTSAMSSDARFQIRTEVGKRYKELIGQGTNEAVQLLQDFVDVRNYNGFVGDLKSLASYADAEIPLTLVDSIYNMVMTILEHLNIDNVSDVLWSLGKMASRVSNAKHRTENNRLWRQLCTLHGCTSRHVTTSMVGLAKLNLRWESMQPTDRAHLERLVSSIAGELNEREVGNLLHSLSRMGVTWSDLSAEVQESLLNNLIRQHKKMKAEHGTMTIYALGILGLSAEQIPQQARDSVYAMSTALLQDVLRKPPLRNRCQQAANVIYGLAKMGVQFANCPAALKESILSTLAVPMQSMNAQEVSNTVYSLCILGLKWQELPREIQTTIQSAIVNEASGMITQGLSITLYGLGMMETPWLSLAPAAVEALQQAVVRCFRTRNIVPELNGQAVANAIYALGLCQVSWLDFPEDVRAAFLHATERCGPHLKPQEVANLVYGLGLLRADYNSLPEGAKDALAQAYIRLSGRMMEQEMCSYLHGLAKMEAKWDDLRPPLQDAVMACIAHQGTMNCVCLGCTVYSLGLLGAQWDALPVEVAQHIVRTAQSRPLVDQTLSNTMYGLSLMGAEWDTLQPALRDTLLQNLGSPDAFLGDNPQHVSNTLWSLGKMDATWLQLPGAGITAALLRCVDRLSRQELANAVYGLAIVDVSWSALSVEVVEALEKALLMHVDAMTVQEIANVMYSLTLLSFDFHAAEEISTVSTGTNMTPSSAPTVKNERLESLWRIHEAVQRAYVHKDRALFVRENYDQFAIYFELMRVLRRGRAIAAQIYGDMPQPSGPAGTVPSKMHAMTVQAMMYVLRGMSAQFECVNEFNGLQGVFPVDAAVYHDGHLVALVEVDGEFHYKLLGQQLRRKDRLKEFLYRCHYPSVPLYRMRSDQLQVIGFPRAGEALATWIYRNVQDKPDIRSSVTEVQVNS